MCRNYIKITLRNIKKHKGYSFINIAGLAVGMTCCILSLLWVQIIGTSFLRLRQIPLNFPHFPPANILG